MYISQFGSIVESKIVDLHRNLYAPIQKKGIVIRVLSALSSPAIAIADVGLELVNNIAWVVNSVASLILNVIGTFFWWALPDCELTQRASVKGIIQTFEAMVCETAFLSANLFCCVFKIIFQIFSILLDPLEVRPFSLHCSPSGSSTSENSETLSPANAASSIDRYASRGISHWLEKKTIPYQQSMYAFVRDDEINSRMTLAPLVAVADAMLDSVQHLGNVLDELAAVCLNLVGLCMRWGLEDGPLKNRASLKGVVVSLEALVRSVAYLGVGLVTVPLKVLYQIQEILFEPETARPFSTIEEPLIAPTTPVCDICIAD